MSSRVLSRSVFVCVRRSSLRFGVAVVLGLFVVTSVASAAHLGAGRGQRGRVPRSLALARSTAVVARAAAAPVSAGAPSFVGAEVPALRTQNSRTYLSKTGGYVEQISAGPLNYKDGQGGWQPIDNTLTASSGGYTNTGNSYSVSLPSSLAAPIVFRRDGGSASLQLVGGAGTASVSGASAIYASALPGVTEKLTAANASVKETLTLASSSAPSRFAYTLTLSPGLTAAASGSSPVAIRDAAGKTLFSLARPFLVDAKGATSSAAQVTLTGSAPTYSLTVSLDRSWLSAAGRAWPVTVDPSWFTTQSTFIESGNPTESFGGWGAIYVGDNGSGNYDRGLLSFDLSSLPAGMQIVHAELTMHQYNEAYCDCGESVDVAQLSRDFTENATWNTSDGTTSWTTPGGDAGGAISTEPVGAATGWYEWQVDTAAIDWYEHPADNHGFLIKATDESSNTNLAEFESGDETQNQPYLWVTYQPRVGLRSFYGYQDFGISDRVSASVNLGNGNLVVAAHDATITGVNGFNLDLTHYYNSLDANLDGEGNANISGEVGAHWSFIPYCNISWDGTLQYEDPTGYEVDFPAKAGGASNGWLPADGMNATPSIDTSQSGWDWLTFNGSGVKDHCSGSAGFGSMQDRNGNSFAYYLGGAQLLHIDDQARNQQDVSFTYNGAGYLEKMTDYVGRVWQYAYNTNGDLTSVTDPASNTVSYAYNGSDQMTAITDPNGNQTAISYDTDNRVSQIEQGLDRSGNCPVGATCPITGFSYPASLDATCNGVSGAASETIVTDPNGHQSTYCLDDRLRVLKSEDPLGRTTSQTYTANDDIASSTNTVNGVTDNSYDGKNNLIKVEGPAPSGSPRMTSSYAFGDSANPYSSTGLVDEQGNSWNAAYDGNGNLCAKSEGTASATLTCSGGSGEGKNQMFFTYTNGLLTQAKDGNGNTYSYSYDPTSHDQTGITNPSPLGSESMSYDSLNRLASYTDGRRKTTSYSYDGSITTSLDRLTKITYADGSSVSYGYDDNGNLTSETDKDPGGTTTASVTYSYDALNRLTSEAQPNGTVTYTYTPGGQLDTVTENGLQTKYYYDKANRLAAIDEPGVTANSACSSSYPGATICLGYSETPGSGSQSVITYPGGATVTSNYDTAGRLTSILNKNGAGTTVASYAYTYAYNSGAADGALRQSVTPLGGGAQYYCYDPTGRLASAGSTTLSCPSTPAANGSWADPNAPYQYVYDANGNMTSKTINGTTTIYTVNGANELKNGGYSFDGEGNQLSSPTIASLQYNDADQTTSITPTTTALTASYVGNGQTNRTSFAGNSYLNDQQGTARFTSGNTNTDYSNDPAGTTYSENVGGSHYYFAFDGLGSVVGLFDSTGNYVSSWTATYDPYGNLTNTIPTGYPQFNIRYASYWYDTQTGLYKAGQRYYDPTTGRWTQRDPIDNPTDLTGWNRYDYAADDPINLTDPSGLCAWYDVVCHATTFARGVSRDWRDFTVGTLGFIGAGALYAVGAIATGACFDATEGLDSIDCVKIGGMFASLGNASGAIGVYEYGRVYRAGKRRRRR